MKTSLLLALLTYAWIPAVYAENTAIVPGQSPGAAESIHKATVEWFDKAIDRVDQMKEAAEAVADKMLGEGQTPNDVILFAQFVPNEPVDNYERFSTLILGRRNRHNLTILLASRNWPQISRVLDAVEPERYRDRAYFIDTCAPAGCSIQDICVAEAATVATGWAFQGEVIAAVTRKGKMLATYASSYEPNPGQTDESVKDMIVNPKYTVEKVEAGRLAREYLKATRDQLASFGPADGVSVREAAGRLARCMGHGGMVWAVMQGHVHQRGTQTPPELPIKTFGREFEWDKAYAPKLPKGDLLVYMGHVEYHQEKVDVALARGCEVVVISAIAGPQREGVTNIHLGIDKLDACVSIPKYPLHMLPTSGILQAVLWHSLMAETKKLYTEPAPPLVP